MQSLMNLSRTTTVPTGVGKMLTPPRVGLSDVTNGVSVFANSGTPDSGTVGGALRCVVRALGPYCLSKSAFR